MTLRSELNRLIANLEYKQKEYYSTTTMIALSYLYDLRDNKIPKRLSLDRPQVSEIT